MFTCFRAMFNPIARRICAFESSSTAHTHRWLSRPVQAATGRAASTTARKRNWRSACEPLDHIRDDIGVPLANGRSECPERAGQGLGQAGAHDQSA